MSKRLQSELSYPIQRPEVGKYLRHQLSDLSRKIAAIVLSVLHKSEDQTTIQTKGT